MLNVKTNLSLVALVAVLGTMAFTATTAQAAPGPVPDDTYTCVFPAGLAGPLNPPIQIGPPLFSPLDGSYSFSGAATCVFVDNEDDAPPFLGNGNGGGAGVFSTLIVSQGNYDNLLVGTGNAIGQACIIETAHVVALGHSNLGHGPCPALNPLVAPPGPQPTYCQPQLVPIALPGPGYTCADYQIGFAGSVGALQIRRVTNNNGDSGPAGSFLPDAGTGNGSVQITATGFGQTAADCAPSPAPCVKQFSVAGAFEVTLFDN